MRRWFKLGLTELEPWDVSKKFLLPRTRINRVRGSNLPYRMVMRKRMQINKNWTFLMHRTPQFWNTKRSLESAWTKLKPMATTRSLNFPMVAPSSLSASSQSITWIKPVSKKNRSATSSRTAGRFWWPKFQSMIKLRKQSCLRSTLLWKRRSWTRVGRLSKKIRISTKSLNKTCRRSPTRPRKKCVKSPNKSKLCWALSMSLKKMKITWFHRSQSVLKTCSHLNVIKRSWICWLSVTVRNRSEPRQVLNNTPTKLKKELHRKTPLSWQQLEAKLQLPNRQRVKSPNLRLNTQTITTHRHRRSRSSRNLRVEPVI
jgi:hypothetical protein